MCAKNLIPTIVEEIFAGLQIPGGATASQLLQTIFQKKANEAREILFDEIKSGHPPALTEDDTVYIIYRYLRAAQEGAARVNLRLLAQVIAGDPSVTSLTSDKFLYYADMISALRIEEIKLLGIMVREKRTSSHLAEISLLKHFNSEEIEIIFQSLLRTGLVTLYQEISVEDQDDHKSSDRYKSHLHTSYHLTSLMEEMKKFISFDLAIEKEDIFSSQ